MSAVLREGKGYLGALKSCLENQSLPSRLHSLEPKWKVLSAIALAGSAFVVVKNLKASQVKVLTAGAGLTATFVIVKSVFSRNTRAGNECEAPAPAPAPAPAEAEAEALEEAAAEAAEAAAEEAEAAEAPAEAGIPVPQQQGRHQGGAPSTSKTVALQPGMGKELPLLETREWGSTEVQIYPKFVTQTRGVSTSIGMALSLLLPEGNAFFHKNLEGIPECPYIKFLNEGGTQECVQFSFGDRSYAVRLYQLFQNIGLSPDWKEIDMPVPPYGYYHGAIVIENPEELLFIMRFLCNQGFKDVNDWLDNQQPPASTFLSRLRGANLDYTDAGVERWISQVKRAETSNLRIIPPSFKIYANGVSEVIGAATALLIRGWTSKKEAIRLRGIVNVEFSQEEGLSLYFPNHRGGHKNGLEHARATQSGLDKVGLSSFSVEAYDRTNAHGSYSGVVKSQNADHIVLFLMRLCHLTRRDIQDWVNARGMEEAPLGQEVNRLCTNRLAGEAAYEITFVVNEETDIGFDRLSVNLNKLKFVPLPDLPPEAQQLDVSTELQVQFDAAKQAIINGVYGDGASIDQLKIGIENIKRVLGGEGYSGVPTSPEGKDAFLKKFTFMLKHVMFLLDHCPQEEGDGIDIKALSLARLALGGIHCAGGHVQAMVAVYQSTKRFSPYPPHHQGDVDMHLPQVDNDIMGIVDALLSDLRVSVFEEVIRHFGTEAHTRIKILKLIGLERGIPGAEMALYEDPYAAIAYHISKEEALRIFDQKYTSEKIVNHLREKIKYQGEVDMGKVVDFFNRHKPDDLDFGEIVDDDFEHIRTKFLKQLLVISGHLTYN